MKIRFTNNSSLNDDGSIKTKNNESVLQEKKNPGSGSPYSFKNTSEITGDNPDRVMMQFEPCKYKKENCKYIDINGLCMAENCLFDTEETPVLTKKFWTKCLICNKTFCIDPREMRVPFCSSCISRMQQAETLPFTCIHCGKQQNHPSKIIFSRICDECVDHQLFNDQYTVINHTYVKANREDEASTDPKMI